MSKSKQKRKAQRAATEQPVAQSTPQKGFVDRIVERKTAVEVAGEIASRMGKSVSIDIRKGMPEVRAAKRRVGSKPLEAGVVIGGKFVSAEDRVPSRHEKN